MYSGIKAKAAYIEVSNLYTQAFFPPFFSSLRPKKCQLTASHSYVTLMVLSQNPRVRNPYIIYSGHFHFE